jgi:hypothetical protein
VLTSNSANGFRYEDKLVSRTGLGGEYMQIDQDGGLRGNFRYLLRPEVAESVFVAWRTTGDQRYRDVAWRIFAAIKLLQVEWSGGFHGLEDVRLGFVRPSSGGSAARAKRVVDLQPSYFMAETLK